MPTVTPTDSMLKNALENYYDFLVANIQGLNSETATDKVVLGNLITAFDISKETPYYNEGLFAKFADRPITGPVDRFDARFLDSDRYSFHYEQVIAALTTKIDQRHPEIVPKLTELNDAIAKLREKLNSFRLETAIQWAKLSAAMNITPESKDYELKYIKFLEDVRYEQQTVYYTGRMDEYFARIDQVRRAVYEAHELPLLSAALELQAGKWMARPKSARFERSVPHVDELTFANPETKSRAVFDVYPETTPVGDLVSFLEAPVNPESVRRFEVSSATETKSRFTKTWGGSAGANFGFFSIGGGGGGSTTVVEEVRKVNGMKITINKLSEYIVGRGYWFNPALLTEPKLKAAFLTLSSYKKLGNVVASLVIAQGISIELESTDHFSSEYWSQNNLGGSGGFSIMGFSFGGSAGGGANNWSLTVSDDKKKLLLADAPTVCRVVAHRVSPIATFQPDGVAQGKILGVTENVFKAFSTGNLSYVQMMSERSQRG